MKFKELLKPTAEKKGQEEFDTKISAKTKITGNILFSGSFFLNGEVKGDILTADSNAPSSLHIGPSGVVNGQIKADSLILEGVIIGDVHSYQSLIIANTADLRGNAYYNRLSVSEGAQCEGKFLSSYRNSTGNRETEIELITHQSEEEQSSKKKK